MPSDSLPQLIDALLRLPLLQPAELKDLIQNLSNPQASAQELLRRGWITRDQFASAFPAPDKNRETLVVGIGEDDAPPDADSDNWDLLPNDEESVTDQKPVFESPPPEQPDEIPLATSQAAETSPVLPESVVAPPEFEWQMLPAGQEKKQPRRETDTDRLLRKWMRWASTGMLILLFFLGSFVAGQRFFAPEPQRRPSPGPAALKQSTKARGTTDPVVRANLTRDPNRQPADAKVVKQERRPEPKVDDEQQVPEVVIIEQQGPAIEFFPAPNDQPPSFPSLQGPTTPAGAPGSGGVMVLNPQTLPAARTQNASSHPTQPTRSNGPAKTSPGHGSTLAGHRSR